MKTCRSTSSASEHHANWSAGGSPAGPGLDLLCPLLGPEDGMPLNAGEMRRSTERAVNAGETTLCPGAWRFGTGRRSLGHHQQHAAGDGHLAQLDNSRHRCWRGRLHPEGSSRTRRRTARRSLPVEETAAEAAVPPPGRWSCCCFGWPLLDVGELLNILVCDARS